MQTLNSIELRSYGISFNNKVALNDVSLKLNMTGVTVLIGPKGSGRTSLLSSLAGIHDNNPSFKCWGEVYFFDRLMGADALSLRPVFVRSVMSQMDRSLEDVILSHYKFPGANTVARQEFIEKLILDSKLEELLPMLKQRLIDLKPVWYRIVMILVAAASKTPALMLDEPMKKLNFNEVVLLQDYIKHLSKKQKIIVALNNKEQAHEIADDIVFLTENGILFHGPNDTFFTTPPSSDVVSQFLLNSNINNVMSNNSNLDDSIQVETFINLPTPPSDTSYSPNKFEKDDYGNLVSNNFSWVVRGALAVCSMPGIYNSLGYDLDILASKGVTKLITLTPEDIYQAELAVQGLSNIHMPISDGKMPSITQMHMLLLKMKELIETGDVLAVYCLDECGATGIVIAAWMIKEDGVMVEEAIKTLGLINPSLIQSLVHVEFLKGFFNDVRNRTQKI